jgi:hypothetical protein
LPDSAVARSPRLGDCGWLASSACTAAARANVASFEALLGDDRAALVFADCPYNVPIDGFVSGNGQHRHREFVMAAGEMSPPQFTAFLRAIFRNCVRFAAEGSIH